MNMSKSEKLFSRDSKKVERLLKMFDYNNSLPNYLDLPDFVDFAEQIDRTINLISINDQPRTIVLETWLIIDFSLRHILRHGLEIHKFCDDNFDFLPQGFRNCCHLLKTFIKRQNEKPINPSKGMIQLPEVFNNKLLKDKPFFEKFIKYESEYCEEVGGSLIANIGQLNDSKYRNVNEHWLESVNKINDEWYTKAEKLNKVRNKAAHSYDIKGIYQELGITGNKQIDRLKEYCVKTIKDLVGLK